MQSIVNTEQAEAWNGYEGRHWADNHDRYDAVNSAFNAPLLDAAAIAAGERVLDIGCGNGQVTRLAARRAVGGRVLGVDLSAPMLARARSLTAAEGIDNLTFEHGDVQVHPFAEGAFDVALSRFGVMFFADPVAAFANVRRALRPAGRLAFLCLQDAGRNDVGAVFAAMAAELPRPAAREPAASGPFSFADPADIRLLLGRAGFQDVTVTGVRAPQFWGRDAAEAAAFLGDWGPVRFQLDRVGPAVAERARAALVAALRRHQETDGVRLRGAAWLVTARR